MAALSWTQRRLSLGDLTSTTRSGETSAKPGMSASRGILLADVKAMSGSRTVSGSFSSQTPESDATSDPSLRGFTKLPSSRIRFTTILPCLCPAAMVSCSAPRISSPRTPSLWRRSRSSAVSSFGPAAVVVEGWDFSVIVIAVHGLISNTDTS